MHVVSAAGAAPVAGPGGAGGRLVRVGGEPPARQPDDPGLRARALSRGGAGHRGAAREPQPVGDSGASGPSAAQRSPAQPSAAPPAPKPLPPHTHLPQPPAPAAPSRPALAPPCPGAPAVTFADHRRPDANFSPSRPAPARRPDAPAGLPAPHPPTRARPPRLLAVASLRLPGAFPQLPSLDCTPPPRHSGFSPEAQPGRGGAGRTPPHPAPRTPPPAAAAPHVCPGPGAPAVTGADGSLRERGLRRTPPELRSVCCSPPPERGGAEVPSRLSGPSGSRSPGRCPPAPLPPEGRSGGGGGSPGLTSSLLSTSAPGFPAPTPALGLSPPLPPPSSQPRARLPSAPPPPSARRPSRPPLTSAAGLRVGAGRREEEKGKLSGHVPDAKPSASPFLRRFDALRLHSWRGPRPHAQTAATHTQRLAADRPPGHRSEISRQAMLDVKNDPGCRRRKVFLDGSWKALCPSKPVSDTEME
ncbi:uncharacterized protein [Canis lupus baileyi]|uniref:uncharacterized protein n=1 Tax=Canis lupus baileyi TaxID=143281 RepID=UPI003B96F441